MSSYDWLLVGLGNPGASYALNRHNIGFMALDVIGDGVTWKAKHKGLLAEKKIADQRVLLLKPQTYMNLSGESVREVAGFYKIPVEKIAVLYDELDLPPCTLRIKKGGGSGGHNGIKSMDQQLGSQNYWRLRCGIGHPGSRDAVTPYVLSDFSKADQKDWLPDFLMEIDRNIGLFLAGNDSHMMTRVAEAFKKD